MTNASKKKDNQFMNSRFENNFSGYQDTELFYQGWEVNHPKAAVVIIHGQSEHSECYNHFAEFLNQNHINAYAYDLRGHGKSSGQRGYTKEFSDYEKDTHLFVQQVQSQHAKDIPLILFGHSMGGLIAIKSLIAYSTAPFQALTLSSPALGFSIKVPAYKDLFAQKLGHYLPRLTLGNEIAYTNLSSVKSVLEFYKKDTLRHKKIAPSVYLGMKNGFELVKKYKDEINIPVLMQISGIDPVCSPQSSKDFFNSLTQIKHKKLICYDNSLHEILNDIEAKQVMKDYFHFIKDFIKE